MTKKDVIYIIIGSVVLTYLIFGNLDGTFIAKVFSGSCPEIEPWTGRAPECR